MGTFDIAIWARVNDDVAMERCLFDIAQQTIKPSCVVFNCKPRLLSHHRASAVACDFQIYAHSEATKQFNALGSLSPPLNTFWLEHVTWHEEYLAEILAMHKQYPGADIYAVGYVIQTVPEFDQALQKNATFERLSCYLSHYGIQANTCNLPVKWPSCAVSHSLYPLISADLFNVSEYSSQKAWATNLVRMRFAYTHRILASYKTQSIEPTDMIRRCPFS